MVPEGRGIGNQNSGIALGLGVCRRACLAAPLAGGLLRTKRAGTPPNAPQAGPLNEGTKLVLNCIGNPHCGNTPPAAAAAGPAHRPPASSTCRKRDRRHRATFAACPSPCIHDQTYHASAASLLPSRPMIMCGSLRTSTTVQGVTVSWALIVCRRISVSPGICPFPALPDEDGKLRGRLGGIDFRDEDVGGRLHGNRRVQYFRPLDRSRWSTSKSRVDSGASPWGSLRARSGACISEHSDSSCPGERHIMDRISISLFTTGAPRVHHGGTTGGLPGAGAGAAGAAPPRRTHQGSASLAVA